MIGFYLQKFLETPVSDSKTLVEERDDNFKLRGYTINDHSLISLIDEGYRDSTYIKSMKVKNSGEFYGYVKVLSEETIKELEGFVENKLVEGANAILDGEFKIAPLKYSDEKECSGCKYCSFKDICFVTKNDIRVVDKVEYKKFLGGEDNGSDMES